MQELDEDGKDAVNNDKDLRAKRREKPVRRHLMEAGKAGNRRNASQRAKVEAPSRTHADALTSNMLIHQSREKWIPEGG